MEKLDVDTDQAFMTFRGRTVDASRTGTYSNSFNIVLAVWKIGNYFARRLSLGKTFLYGVTCIIKCLPYCSHFACNFLQPNSKGEMALETAA